MNDRSAALAAAVRAQDKLIAEAQRLLTAYVETKRLHPDAVINDLLWLFDGPRQRETQLLVREALGDDPGRSPDVSDWFVFSRDADGRDAKSRALPSEDAALTHARDLRRQKHEVDRIEGPGKVLDKNEIEKRLASHPE